MKGDFFINCEKPYLYTVKLKRNEYHKEITTYHLHP